MVLMRADAHERNKFHQRLILNVEDVVLLLARYIDIPQGTQVEAKVRQEALRCFQVRDMTGFVSRVLWKSLDVRADGFSRGFFTRTVLSSTLKLSSNHYGH